MDLGDVVLKMTIKYAWFTHFCQKCLRGRSFEMGVTRCILHPFLKTTSPKPILALTTNFVTETGWNWSRWWHSVCAVRARPRWRGWGKNQVKILPPKAVKNRLCLCKFLDLKIRFRSPQCKACFWSFVAKFACLFLPDRAKKGLGDVVLRATSAGNLVNFWRSLK